MKILVRAPNWIGDQILAYPFFHFLRAGFPSARITSVCPPWVESLQFRSLIDQVIPLPKPQNSGFPARILAVENGAARLRQDGTWDLAITLPNSFSSAWLLKRSGAVQRKGYNTDLRGWLLTERIYWQPDPPEHRADSYLKLLPDSVRPHVSARDFWETHRFDPDAAWPETVALNRPQGEYWILAPGSVAESRRWPADRFAQIARKVAQETGWVGLVVGGAPEAPIAEALISDRSTLLQDWTARGTVAHYSKIFANAKFTLSNDSGLAHFATLCGSPVHIVWGAGEPKRTQPLGPGRVSIVLNPVECWPCERNSCRLPGGQKLACLKGIEPEMVWKEIELGIRKHQH